MTSPPIAGIWGSFQTGNYGDELMALYVAQVYRKMGVEVRVYGLRPELAERYGLVTADDVNLFFLQIRFCVFAEGGCLVDARDGGNEKGGRYAEMAAMARMWQVPVYPFSIGGSAAPVVKPNGGLGALWGDGIFRDTVVRLPGDVALVESLGGEAEWVPDMLWDAARILDCEVEREKCAGRPLRVGVNFLRCQVPENLCEWVDSSVPEGVEVHWLTAHPEKRVTGELRPEVESERVKIFRQEDPLELLRFLGTLDVVVSSKLHIGLTSLTQGAAFLSCHGRPSTHALLREVCEDLIREEGARDLFAAVFADPAAFIGLVPWERIEELREAASENRGWLRSWAERHDCLSGRLIWHSPDC